VPFLVHRTVGFDLYLPTIIERCIANSLITTHLNIVQLLAHCGHCLYDVIMIECFVNLGFFR